MYENIGGKIKGLAKTVCIIGIVLSCLSGLIQLFAGGAVGFFTGLLSAGIGSLVSWLGTLIMYGFGELIDAQIEAANNTAELVHIMKKGDQPSAPVGGNSFYVSNTSQSGYSSYTAPKPQSHSSSSGFDQNKVPAWKRVQMETESETKKQSVCPRCGMELPEDAVFCPGCGNRC